MDADLLRLAEELAATAVEIQAIHKARRTLDERERALDARRLDLYRAIDQIERGVHHAETSR